MAVPVLMYGSENWSLNRSDKRKIEAAQMRFLRPMAGYTYWDKKRSSNMREQLGIFNINDKLTQYKINWREYIQRMSDNRLPKIISNYKPEGRRNIETPQTRWEEISGRKEQAKMMIMIILYSLLMIIIIINIINILNICIYKTLYTYQVSLLSFKIQF